MNLFTATFGQPDPATADERVVRQLETIPSGRSLLATTGAGWFDRGFLSIASPREAVPDLGGWNRWLPPGAFHYASSVFGILYVAAGDLMWLIDIQIGSIMPTDYALDEAIEQAASTDARTDLLRWPLFDQWTRTNAKLAPGQFLMPVQSPITGVRLEQQSLQPQSAPVALGRTADHFGPTGLADISFVSP